MSDSGAIIRETLSPWILSIGTFYSLVCFPFVASVLSGDVRAAASGFPGMFVMYGDGALGLQVPLFSRFVRPDIRLESVVELL